MYDIKSILPDVKRKPVLHMPKMSFGCFFRAEKYKENGEITYSGSWFKNTVLNVGLDGLAVGRDIVPNNSNSITRIINVGTGTSMPAVTDTGLDSYLAATGSVYGEITIAYGNGDASTGDPAWKSWQRTFAFAIGSCTGNLTELGLSASSNSTYFNRQLFRDQVGDPTVVPVQSDEGLRITVKVVVYAPMAVGETDVADFDLNGVTRAATVTQLGGTWLTTTSGDGRFRFLGSNGLVDESRVLRIATASGSFVEPSSVNADSYTAGNFYRDVEYTWTPDSFAGDWKKIRGYCVSGPTWYALFEIEFDSAVTVSDTEEIKINFRRSWGRV